MLDKWENYYTTDIMSTETSEGQKSIHCELCDATDPNRIYSIPKGSIHVSKVYMELPIVEVRLFKSVDNDAKKGY